MHLGSVPLSAGAALAVNRGRLRGCWRGAVDASAATQAMQHRTQNQGRPIAVPAGSWTGAAAHDGRRVSAAATPAGILAPARTARIHPEVSDRGGCAQARISVDVADLNPVV